MKKTIKLLLALVMLLACCACAANDNDKAVNEYNESKPEWVAEENEAFYIWENQEWMQFVDEQLLEIDPGGKAFVEVWNEYKSEVDRRMMQDEFWNPIEERFIRHIDFYTNRNKNGIPGCIWPEGGVIPGAYAIPYKSPDGIGIIYITENGKMLCLSADRARNDYLFLPDIHTHMHWENEEDVLVMNYEYAVVKWMGFMETWKYGRRVGWVEHPEEAVFDGVNPDGSYRFKTKDNELLVMIPEK